MTNDAEKRLTQFKEDLTRLSPIEIVRKYIISEECSSLSPKQYFDLRSEVADHFELCPNDVLVVGSAKLGFSIAPDTRYCLFHDKSDIDVVIVSSKLFDEVWEYVFSYNQDGGYWPKSDEFIGYLYNGWIRPDKLPRSPRFPFGKKWWSFFLGLKGNQKYGNRTISGALYKSYLFLEYYQKDCVQQCLDEILMSNLEVHNEDISN